jgi:predicted acylesterase/phospholipase RssA
MAQRAINLVEERSVNMVFQGGGVRGIAYAGVLAKIPDWIRIAGVGGTSAGALVAALLAIGKRGDELRKILSDPDLFSLLRKEDVERKQRIIDTWKKHYPQIQKLLGDSGGLQPPSATRYLFDGAERKRVGDMYHFWKEVSADISSLTRDLKAIWSAKGLHSSEPLRAWLQKVLENKKFSHLQDKNLKNRIPDLRIVAANVTTQEYQVYGLHNYPGTDLAEAVHASVSIPIFFEPFVTSGGSRFLVDGGVLSNFPSFLFSQSRNPTIGFRLEDVPPLTRIDEIAKSQGVPLPIRSTLDYLLMLIKTMVEAHDNFRELPADFHLYPVPVPDDIAFDKFNLTKVDADRLYDKAATVRVEWEQDSEPSNKPRTFDPKPQHALAFGIEQGAQLMERYYSADMRAEKLEQDVNLEVTIEQDWSSRYVRTMRLRVTGDQPIFLMRVLALGLPKGPNSLADHIPIYQELLEKGERKNVILIPASNEAEKKGFVAFLDPPVRGGAAARTFLLEHRIKDEFLELDRGGAGVISYQARQLAKEHTLKLQIRVRVDQRLGELAFQTDNSDKFEATGVSEDKLTHLIYRTYTCEEQVLPVYRENGIICYVRRA